MGIDILPTEIIQQIFSYLPGKDLLHCYHVCTRWQTIVSSYSGDYWERKCAKEFNNIYKESHRRADLTWRELYTSLSSWANIGDTEVKITHKDIGPLDTFCFLKNNILSFPTSSSGSRIETKKDVIVYYNLKHEKVIQRACLPPNKFFHGYFEDDDLIICFWEGLSEGIIKIIPKKNQQKLLEITIDKYNQWFVKNGQVFYEVGHYYRTSLHRVSLVDRGGDVELQDTILANDVHGSVLDVSYKKEELYILVSLNMDADNSFMFISKIIDGDGAQDLCRVHGPLRYVIRILEVYGFSWTSYNVFRNLPHKYYRMDVFRKRSVCAPLSYGKYVITGTKDPLAINIYYNPYGPRRELLLHKKRPLKTINLEEYKFDDPQLYALDIFKYAGLGHVGKIDVIETKDGHKLIVIFFKRLFIIELKNRAIK